MEKWKRFEHSVVGDLRLATGLPWKRNLEFRRKHGDIDKLLPPGDMSYLDEEKTSNLGDNEVVLAVECKVRDSWNPSRLIPPGKPIFDLVESARKRTKGWMQEVGARQLFVWLSVVVRVQKVRIVISAAMPFEFGVFHAFETNDYWQHAAKGLYLHGYGSWLQGVKRWAKVNERCL